MRLLTSDNSQSADTTSHGLGDMEYTRHQRLLEPEVDSTPTRGKAMPRAEFDHRFKITMGTVRKCIGRYSVLAGRSKAEELRTGRSAPGDLYKAIRLQYSCLRLKHDQIRVRSKHAEVPGQVNWKSTVLPKVWPIHAVAGSALEHPRTRPDSATKMTEVVPNSIAC